ncbi:hypothetical protein [Thermogutta sp.]|uniref:hypothetical protein n=1 Tax=Thermogutta sp. TaxID=1962930 RepID=UPI0032202D1F
MVASEGLAAVNPPEALLRRLQHHQNRCREIFARQEERLRLAGEGLKTALEQALRNAETVAALASSTDAGLSQQLASMMPTLEAIVQNAQLSENGWREALQWQTDRLDQLTRELATIREELASVRKLKEDLETTLSALQQHSRDGEDSWKTQESQLLAQFEREKQQWANQWNDREAALNALVLRCSQLEEELEALRREGNASAQSQLQERYNLALAEIRELRQKNAELEKKLARGHSNGSADGRAGDGRILDWEAEKQRILAALELESEDSPDGTAQKDRVRIQEIIARTEALLAEKDNEIAELRRLLDEQSTSIGSLAVGAAALERLLDQDEVIRQQREHLRQLEEEWKEKLRKAELEISLERAKIARERALLEEKQRELEEKLEALESAAASGDKAKPPRGRWLTRLGLNGPPNS